MGTVFSIENVVCNEDYSYHYSDPSSGEITVSQTCVAQPSTPSTARLVLKDAEGSNILPSGNYGIPYTFNFKVVESAVIGTNIDEYKSYALTKNVPAKVEIHGGNLPATVVFAIEDVVCNGDYSRH